MAGNPVQIQQQNNMTGRGMDPELYRAASSGFFDTVSRISNWKEQQTPTKNNVLHIYVGKPVNKNVKVYIKAKMVHKEFIENVINSDTAGYSLLFNENTNGDTPLHLAARFGHDEAVKAFIEQISKVNEEDVSRLLRMVNKRKDTALHEAARVGHGAVVELLVQADLNCSHDPNEDGETPLYLAAESGCTGSVLSILRTCEGLSLADKCKGPCGRTALHAAVQWGSPDMVSRILEMDRSLITTQNDEGFTPFHCVAAEIFKPELLKILLKHDNENESSAMYIQDNKGRTPLHIATLRYNLEAIRMIVSSRPDCMEIVDHAGQNVMHYAAKWTCLEIFYQLWNLGNFEKLLNERDSDGNTPLHLWASLLPQSPHQYLHPCISYLSKVFKDHPFLNIKAFNKNNFTVGDIMLTYDSLLQQEYVFKKTNWTVPRGRRVNTYDEDVDIEKATSIGYSMPEYNPPAMKKAAESRLVVAALIATVSFAAGIGIPGGVDQNTGNDMGSAVLKSRTSFKVFMIADTMAFTSSILAIVVYFVLVSMSSNWAIQNFSLWALLLNTISLGALMVAFLAGVCAILPESHGLLIGIGVISAIFFIFYRRLLKRTYGIAKFWFFERFRIRNYRVLR